MKGGVEGGKKGGRARNRGLDTVGGRETGVAGVESVL